MPRTRGDTAGTNTCQPPSRLLLPLDVGDEGEQTQKPRQSLGLNILLQSFTKTCVEQMSGA